MIKRYREPPGGLLEGRWPFRSGSDTALLEYVKTIVEDVKERGDEAVIEYTERFDECILGPEEIRVTRGEKASAYERVHEGQIQALRESKRRLEAVEAVRIERLGFALDLDDVEIRCEARPLERVGCYVPGGKATYPSSVIMNAVPAKLAEVPSVALCTPPDRNGRISPLTLVAADICGIDEVYKVGGAQAIAAMAYGTSTIPKVNKVVGPGNIYVNAAKVLVSRDVAVDKLAGPSEVVVVADDSANSRLIALDLISQAEHGPGGLFGLVTTSARLADQVESVIGDTLECAFRSDVVVEAMAEGSFIYVASSLDEAAQFVDEVGPEHLEIMVKDSDDFAMRISNAGMILLGDYTPVSSTDYCIGTNHVLPTRGFSKISSGTTALDYLKLVSVVRASREGLGKIKNVIRTLSEVEGLLNHGRAVDGRFDL